MCYNSHRQPSAKWRLRAVSGLYLFFKFSIMDVLNHCIAVKCDHHWQKGFFLGHFDKCDNAFRIDDDDFCFAHFRSLKSFTFLLMNTGQRRTQGQYLALQKSFRSFLFYMTGNAKVYENVKRAV